MVVSKLQLAVALASVALPAISASASNVVTHTTATINGLAVDRFFWTDSQGKLRTVAIKQEGNGNPGHGGYAVRFTYQTTVASTVKTVAVDPAESVDGFGYFVSHERYRDFTDGDYDTIAHKVFKVDDSPLGRGIASSSTIDFSSDRSEAAITISTTYHHYGTVNPIPKDADGNDTQATPTDKASLRNYNIPVTIRWTFQSGKDYPLVRTALALRAIGPDRINFDVRGPYGAMNFNPSAGTIDTVMWGDRYHFINRTTPLTRNSTWTWNEANSGARYTALVSGGYEMGLFEPRPFAKTALADGFARERGLTSTTFNQGRGCTEQQEKLPCDYEWPYQSAQYSLPYDNTDGTTNYPKIAWGSSAYYGTGPSLTAVFDTSKTSEPFDGDPNVLVYNICVVLGRTVTGGLTRNAAQGATTYNCAAPF